MNPQRPARRAVSISREWWCTRGWPGGRRLQCFDRTMGSVKKGNIPHLQIRIKNWENYIMFFLIGKIPLFGSICHFITPFSHGVPPPLFQITRWCCKMHIIKIPEWILPPWISIRNRVCVYIFSFHQLLSVFYLGTPHIHVNSVCPLFGSVRKIMKKKKILRVWRWESASLGECVSAQRVSAGGGHWHQRTMDG